MNLQSGFVLAVLVALIVFADRIGGQREAARRIFQLALGAALAFTVAAGTLAAIEPDNDASGSIFEQSITTGNEEDELSLEDVSDRSVIANTVRFAAGIIALLFGLGGLARYSTLPLGVVFGGLLLIFAGGGGNELFGYSQLLSASARSSRETDVIYFLVLAVGLSLLFWFGYNEYERESLAAPDDADTDGVTA